MKKMRWNSSKMSGNLRNSAKFFGNLRNSSKFFEISEKKKNIFEEIIKNSKGFSTFCEDFHCRGHGFPLISHWYFIGFYWFYWFPLTPIKARAQKVSKIVRFHFLNPTGPGLKTNLFVKGTRKIENGGKSLGFQNQILKHLPVCDVVLGVRGRKQKSWWGVHGHR